MGIQVQKGGGEEGNYINVPGWSAATSGAGRQRNRAVAEPQRVARMERSDIRDILAAWSDTGGISSQAERISLPRRSSIESRAC
jgi:hypothetical protein